jgi:tRNA(Ile)-lysidine synthase
LVVAVSGGPDSVALLRALIDVRGDLPVPLVVAHLNHQLRGSESDGDEAFVVDLHARMVAAGVENLHLTHEKIDLHRLAAEQGGNLESLARKERYRWLTEVATRYSLHHVATGHTANDQAETVLHRLMRGAGLDGLRGIAFRRPLSPGVEAVRPLLHITRDQVMAWLEEIGQPARHDSSNDDPTFTRNRIRHELLPLLARDYNPRIVEVLMRLAAQAEESFSEEEESAGELLRQAEKPRAAGVVVLDAACLRQASPRLVRAALRQVWQREGWPMGEMGFDHWQRLAELIDEQTGAHDLPGGVHARRRGGVLQLRAPGEQTEAKEET